MEKLQRFAYPIILVYLWTMMILLGAIVLETFMVYPNIFHDPPRSLEQAMAFMTERGPSDFFPPLGFLSWVGGIGALALGWRVKEARWWILLSVLMIVAEGVVSMLFFWPRNEVMFVEGAAVHSTEALRQTAWEFQTLHWSRLAFNAVSAAAIFMGFLSVYRQRVLTQFAEASEREAGSRRRADRDGHAASQATRALAPQVAAR